MAASLGTSYLLYQLPKILHGEYEKRTSAWEAEESPSVEAVVRKQLVETVTD
jgi:hypothetical protein